MTKCERTQQLLAEYRTDTLGERARREIEAHLAECPGCARELAVLDDVLSFVEENVALAEPPVGMWNAVYNRIAEPVPRPSLVFGRATRWFAKPIHAAGAALATAALVAGIALTSLRPAAPPSMQPQSNEYIQGHALQASHAPFADHSGYLTLVSVSSEQAE